MQVYLLGFGELIGCAWSAVYFVVVDDDLNCCLGFCCFDVGRVGLILLVLLGQHYVLAFCVV